LTNEEDKGVFVASTVSADNSGKTPNGNYKNGGASATATIQEPKGFGTFAGVFTPCVLTIFGVILFLRVGYVIGNAGLLRAFLILAIAKGISILTTLSLSAIATNQEVKGGGAYFLISRSLGVGFGGSIGLVLYLAQAISVALYIIGFTEAFCVTFPQFAPYSTLLASSVCFLTFLVVVTGAAWAIKVQFFILGALMISIVSFFVGGLLSVTFVEFTHNLTTNLAPSYTEGTSFWILFAIFFPAVTGIMAGASMSGDLADAGKSLPSGTIYAVAFTATGYILQFIIMAGCASRADLIGNPMILKKMSLWGPLVDVGIWAATLSSALGSFVGAPRVLQALAKDGIFPKLSIFAIGIGEEDEPRNAVYLTYFIAMVAILAGDLNVIAPVITMFFLLTYGMVNYSCWYEASALNPSFRPRFKFFHKHSALLGFLGCLGVMMLISVYAALISIFMLIALYQYINKVASDVKKQTGFGKKKELVQFGDAQEGFIRRRVINDLVTLDRMNSHEKNWRPQILLFSGNPRNRGRLTTIAQELASERGCLFVGNVLVGSFEQHHERVRSQEESIRQFLIEKDVLGVPAVVIGDTYESAFLSMVQCVGTGSLRPNIVMLGWCEQEDKRISYATSLRRVTNLGLDILIFRINVDDDGSDNLDGSSVPVDGSSVPVDGSSVPDDGSHAPVAQSSETDGNVSTLNDNPPPVEENSTDVDLKVGSIDLWWRGRENGSLMVLLAYLLCQNERWKSAKLRVIRSIENEAGVAQSREHLEKLLYDARVDGEAKIIVAEAGNPGRIIREVSSDTDLVMIGMGVPAAGEEEKFMENMDAITANLKRVLIVKSTKERDANV
jgi:amino acid transporter